VQKHGKTLMLSQPPLSGLELMRGNEERAVVGQYHAYLSLFGRGSAQNQKRSGTISSASAF
jgi:hypothetical protein